MTSEEFDEILEQTNAVICNREWYERAIKALKQELRDCKTCINSDKGKCAGTEECHECMWESKYEQEPCEGCISRLAAIDKMQELENEDIKIYGCSIPEVFDGQRAIEALKALPSIQPKSKTGHWIDHQEGRWIYAKCSECGTVHDTRTNYCPNCGCRMVEPQESEGV